MAGTVASARKHPARSRRRRLSNASAVRSSPSCDLMKVENNMTMNDDDQGLAYAVKQREAEEWVAVNSPADVRAKLASADQYEQQDIRLAVRFRILEGDSAFATEFPELVAELKQRNFKFESVAEAAELFEPHADKLAVTPRYNEVAGQPFVFLDLPGKPKL